MAHGEREREREKEREKRTTSTIVHTIGSGGAVVERGDVGRGVKVSVP